MAGWERLTSRRMESSWLLKVGLIRTSTMGDPSVTSMLVKPLEGASALPPLPPTTLPCNNILKDDYGLAQNHLTGLSCCAK